MSGVTAPDSTASARQLHFANRPRGYFDVLLALFCIVVLVSNISATKGIELGSGSVVLGPVQVWPIITDGGAVLFPLAYILGDVVSEVYGMAAARRMVFMGFATTVLAFVTFWIVLHAPAASFYAGQESFRAVVIPGIQIVVASLAAFTVGNLLNAWVLVRMKKRTYENQLVARLASSTGVGEIADTLIFCAIASSAIGITTFSAFVNYFVVGVVFKVGVEFLVMPVTMLVIGWLKRREPSYWESTESA